MELTSISRLMELDDNREAIPEENRKKRENRKANAKRNEKGVERTMEIGRGQAIDCEGNGVRMLR